MFSNAKRGDKVLVPVIAHDFYLFGSEGKLFFIEAHISHITSNYVRVQGNLYAKTNGRRRGCDARFSIIPFDETKNEQKAFTEANTLARRMAGINYKMRNIRTTLENPIGNLSDDSNHIKSYARLQERLGQLEGLVAALDDCLQSVQVKENTNV